MPDSFSGRVWAVVPAAGIGQRMGGEHPKQYLELAGRTILEHSLTRLADHPAVHAVQPVIRDDDPFWPGVRERLAGREKVLAAVPGGGERQESVANGMKALDNLGPEDLVLVHDAVRPCIGTLEMDAVVGAAREADGAILAVPVADTLKRVDGDGQIEATVDRKPLWRAQTPQVFAAHKLAGALDRALAGDAPATDEAMVMEQAGYRVRVVPGREDNLKITQPEDLALAATVLEGQ
ncbi:2-C-methyl-D-erythritol 4-phosphate cytidylyltransferase [Thiohalorhabdus sp.]|uniref:2-C-methyl-D-erythritol 4-phosphate cytidylyltransferase n=1 Tax=Thiohalorhabdus sp. TaxID=3094134 RepID=UPI002FC39912